MNGIIVINKTKNCTSHDIVKNAKKIFNEKIGHTGTLDPMATGVLPLLIGKGTLCSKYLINHDKIYEVELQLGIKTETGDIEGNIIEEQYVDINLLDEENVKKVLKTFIGKQEQVPPIYSAIKVNGKKLYEYARIGQDVEIKPRKIEIYKIELIKIDKENKKIFFKVHCSKGTYIRSLCEDIAKKIGTVGFMKNLNRVQVGKFNIEDSVTIEELQKNIENNEFLNKKIISIEKLFENCEEIILNDKELELLLNGVMLTKTYTDEVYRIYNNNIFIGTGIVKNQLLKRDIIL